MINYINGCMSNLIKELSVLDHFRANEVRFLQNEATEWIQKANTLIIEAANEGKTEVQIPIYENGSKEHNGYYNAPLALQAHFKGRGFIVQPNGQSSIIISWEEAA